VIGGGALGNAVKEANEVKDVRKVVMEVEIL